MPYPYGPSLKMQAYFQDLPNSDKHSGVNRNYIRRGAQTLVFGLLLINSVGVEKVFVNAN